MPFTLAHPAAVLPISRFLRGRVIASALVIGSMAPDLPNLLPDIASRAESHSVAGLFWFSVPVGLLAYLVFHLVIARPVAGLLPDALRLRLAPYLQDPTRLSSASLARAIASLFLGAVTHLAWDAFTHPDAPAVIAFALLRQPWMRIGLEPIAGYRVLQILSTAFGMCAVAIWGWRWWRAGSAEAAATLGAGIDPMRAASVGGILGIAFGFALHAALGARSFSPSVEGVMQPLRRGAVAGMEGLLLAIVAFSVAWHLVTGIERLRGVLGRPGDGSG